MQDTFRNRRRTLCAGLAAMPLAALAPRLSFEQAGRRPYALVVPYTPGGSTDLLARLFAEGLGNQLGERVIVENRPGANGTIGATQVANAPPDGRTLCYTFGNLLLNQQFLMKNPGVDPLKDLEPVTRTAVIDAAFVAAADAPFNDLREFIDLARRNPGKHSYAFYGDLASAAVAAEAGIDLIRVPYKGGVPGMTDVAGGRVDMIYSSIAQSGPLLRSGKLKALAVAGDKRLSEFPNVPTVREILPGYRALDYQVVLAPKGTPKAVIDDLYRKSVAVLTAADMRRQFEERGSTVAPMTPEELRAFMAADHAALAKVVKAAGIQAE
jgi:tripartite-type tricarboxylate transporter receptor subunit TctC